MLFHESDRPRKRVCIQAPKHKTTTHPVHDDDASCSSSSSSSSPEVLEPTLEELEQEQSRNQSRFRHRMEDIFERYAHDFTETADEIDIRTGHIVLDRGHWLSLPDVQDSETGEESDFSSDEDGILDDHDEDILDFLVAPISRDTPAWLKKNRSSPAPVSGHGLFSTTNANRKHPVEPMSKSLQLPPDDVVLQQFGTAGPAVLDLLKRQAEAERLALASAPAQQNHIPSRATSEPVMGHCVGADAAEEEVDELSALLDSPAHQLRSSPTVSRRSLLSTINAREAMQVEDSDASDDEEQESPPPKIRQPAVIAAVARVNREEATHKAGLARHGPPTNSSPLARHASINPSIRPLLQKAQTSVTSSPLARTSRSQSSVPATLRKQVLTSQQQQTAAPTGISRVLVSPSKATIRTPQPITHVSTVKMKTSYTRRSDLRKEMARLHNTDDFFMQDLPKTLSEGRLLRPRRATISYNDAATARPSSSTSSGSTDLVCASTRRAPLAPLFIDLDEVDDIAISSPIHALTSTPNRGKQSTLQTSMTKTEPLDYNPFDIEDEEDEISGLFSAPAAVSPASLQQAARSILVDRVAVDVLLEESTDEEDDLSLDVQYLSSPTCNQVKQPASRIETDLLEVPDSEESTSLSSQPNVQGISKVIAVKSTPPMPAAINQRRPVSVEVPDSEENSVSSSQPSTIQNIRKTPTLNTTQVIANPAPPVAMAQRKPVSGKYTGAINTPIKQSLTISAASAIRDRLALLMSRKVDPASGQVATTLPSLSKQAASRSSVPSASRDSTTHTEQGGLETDESAGSDLLAEQQLKEAPHFINFIPATMDIDD